MSGQSGNPYLDAYAQQEHAFGSPVGVSPRLSKRLAHLKRLQEMQTMQAKATEAQGTFGQAPVELTPVEKRMKATQDAYESEIKRYGAPDPQTAVEFANTRDPRIVQSQLDQEAQDKKDSEEFWSAVESGSQQHIDVALEGTGPAWDNLRKQKAEVDASRDHLKTLDPNTNADEILRAKPVLESAYAKLAEEEARLNALAAKVEKGISARHAAGLKEAEGLDTIGARYSKVAIPTITGIGKALQRVQRGVAGQLGAASDILAGRGPASIDAIPGVAMFTDSGEARGEQAGKQWGETMAPAFDKTAAFVTRKAIGGMETLSELGGLGGATPLGLLADTVTGVEKPEGMSDEEWNATGKDAMRAKLYGKTAATTFFETITDPLALVDVPFGKILKPFEKFLDKVKPAMLPKLAGKIREVVLGGHIVEDPRWAKSLVAEQALNLDRTAQMYENALQAQRELQAAFDALSPEIAKEVRDTAPRVLEGIPVAERGGFTETPRTLKGREAAGPEQIADYNRVAAEQGNAADAFVKAQQDANAANDDLMKRLRPEQQKAYREWERAKWAVDDAKASGAGAEAERVVIDKTPSEKYAEVLKNIPPEHRAAAVKYAEAVGNDAAALKAMAADNGVSLEMASDRLQGYSTRRFTPEYQRWLALHPESVEKWDKFRLSNLEGRNAREYTFHEVEDFLRKETPEFKGDIWSREHDKLAGENWVILADAVKSRNQIEAFAEVFGKSADGNIPEGAVLGEQLAEQLGLRDPIPALKGKWFSKADVAQLKTLRAPDVPGAWRARINRVTSWLSKAVLANPASLAKDVKGQAMNFWNATGAEGAAHMDEALRAIEGTGPVDKDLAKLMARGLDRASFDSEIRPAVIDATREFGGSRVAGAIEESGFIGAGVRGLEAIPVVGKLPGKALEATGRGLQRIPGLRTVGAAIEGVGERGIGKGVGKVGRALLDGRQQSERVFRLATFKHAKAKGMSDADALNEVVKFWGDFSQLTKVEKKVLRGFVLFFSWQLRALKMSGHQILDHPFRTRLMLTLMAGNVTDREDFPDWIRRQGGWVMGRDLAGNPRTIDLGAGSVHGPLQDLLQGEVSQRLRTDGLSGIPTGIAQTALRRLTPMFQAPIEYATNYDSFSQGQIRLESGQDTAKTRTSDHAPASMWWVAQYFPKIAAALDLRPVNKADGTLSYIHMDPTYNWLFNKVAPGIGAQLGPANALADPRKEMWEAASRAFFGTPTYSIREQDLKSRVGAKVRTMTDALRKSVAGTGLAVNQYGGVYFDKSSPVGAEMIADNERWAEEAKREKLNPDAYKRLKMGSKYQKQLYLIDFGRYLNGWTDALEAPFPKMKPGKDATAGLRRLGRDEAKRDLRRR